MHEKKIPSPLQMALVPGVITLGVTILRFVGELTDGPTILFGDNEAGAMALVGILWLVFVFGGCFGLRLESIEQGSRSLGRRLVLVLAGLLLGVLAGYLCVASGAVTMAGMKDAEGNPLDPRGLPFILAATALPAATAWIAWPRLAKTLLVYAVLARLPVVVLTGLCIWFGGDTTHYTALPEPVPETRMERFIALSIAQVTLWPFFTIAMGTLAGVGAAALAGRRRAASSPMLKPRPTQTHAPGSSPGAP